MNASITEFLKAIGWVLVIESVVIVEQLLSGCDFPCCVEENADGAIDDDSEGGAVAVVRVVEEGCEVADVEGREHEFLLACCAVVVEHQMVLPPQLPAQRGRNNVSRILTHQCQLWNVFKSLNAVVVFPVSFQLQRSLIRTIRVHPICICEVFISFRDKRVKTQINFDTELLANLRLGIIDKLISFPQSRFDIFLFCLYYR